MDEDISPAQYEAKTRGTSRETVKYLSNHHFAALIIFLTVLLLGNLWFEAFKVILEQYVFKRKLTGIDWLLIAIGTTLLIWFIIRYVMKISLPAAFTL